MRKILFYLILFQLSTVFAQKELWGVNTGDEYTSTQPNAYFGNITKFDINGENPVIMHEFNGTEGKIPKGKLFLASNGKLYGTTIYGGTFGPTGSNIEDGAGVLYEYDLILNKFRVINTFNYDPIAANIYAINPNVGVIEPIIGQLFGATIDRIYKYDLNTETVTFYNNLPFGNGFHFELMKASDGNLYGTSYAGQCPNANFNLPDNGCVIKFNLTTNNLSVAHPLNCDIASEGSSPWCQLVETNPGCLLGVTSGGGLSTTGYSGILFEYNFYTDIYIKKIDFNNLTGGYPNSLINGGNGKIYGLCEYGGEPQTCNPTSNFGTLFEYSPNTNVLEIKKYFNTCNNYIRYPTSLVKTSLGNLVATMQQNGLFKYDFNSNSINMPNFPYNVAFASLIEICRKPSYQEILVNSFTVATGANFTYIVQNTNASSYQWQLNGATVVGQTTGVLNITNATTANAGNYTCVMTNECGTTITAPLTVNVNNLGVNNVDISLIGIIKLYPNPTNTFINIELPKNINVTINELKINDILGKEIFYKKENKNKIDVSGFANGIYIVSIKTNYGNWSGKFVKE